MTDTPRSDRFNDVYFSADDGLAESKYVFLDGNDLSKRFAETPHRHVICETGFGTGLNFLSAWTLFDEMAAKGSALDFISIEKYPLSAEEIDTYLARWAHVFGSRLNTLCTLYPMRTPGFHRIQLASNVTLTLIFDDVDKALNDLDASVDTWFLDGFAPAKNPEMWSETVFERMKALSRQGAHFATFTAAGHVKRGLEKAGFHVDKAQGFGRKRDMLRGRLGDGPWNAPPLKDPRSIAVIGGGLAGTAAAFSLRQAGQAVTLYESEDRLATGASGNEIGLINPRISQFRTPDSDFYTAGFTHLTRYLEQNRAADYAQTGTLHLITSADKDKRFTTMAREWGWPETDMQILTADETRSKAGIPVDHPALWLPQSGHVSPRKLCAHYADTIDLHPRTSVDLNDLRSRYDAVIIAAGPGVLDLDPALNWLPVHTVRGQVSHAQANPISQNLKTNICYSGYISAPQNGIHTLGSTFQKWRQDTDIDVADDADNLQKCETALPDLGRLNIKGARAALRTSSQDRFPIIGTVPDYQSWQSGRDHDIENLYISTAHGSHGLVSSLIGGVYLADLILNRPRALSTETQTTLNAARFLMRMRKKGKF